MEKNLIAKANAYSKRYLRNDQYTAKESFVAGIMTIHPILKKEVDALIEDKKKYRDQLDLANAKIAKLTHGGARSGAGRKAKEATVVMRIPLSLVAKVRKLIKNL